MATIAAAGEADARSAARNDGKRGQDPVPPGGAAALAQGADGRVELPVVHVRSSVNVSANGWTVATDLRREWREINAVVAYEASPAGDRAPATGMIPARHRIRSPDFAGCRRSA
jgi:hypothetical protein